MTDFSQGDVNFRLIHCNAKSSQVDVTHTYTRPHTCMHTHYKHTARQLLMTSTRALFVVICLINTNVQRFACAAVDKRTVAPEAADTLLNSSSSSTAALRRAMTHTACLFNWCWNRQVHGKRTINNNQTTTCTKHDLSPEAWGTFISFLFGSYLFWRYRNKLRSSSQVSAAVAAVAAWPVRLLLLLRDVASLPQSLFEGENSAQRSAHLSGARCDGPGERLVGVQTEKARLYLWQSNEFDGCRSASSRGGGLTLLLHSGSSGKLGILSC